MTDEQIIETYWQRDERAIGESNAKYGKYCFAIAQNILQNREDSEECVNDTWLQAWLAIPPQRPAKLKYFFAKITRGISLNRIKAKMTLKRGGGETAAILDELAECLSDPDSVESEYFSREIGGKINLFVKTLSRRECNIFIRRYFFSEPISEIAGRYGFTVHHITVMLSRTRQKLKRYLQKEGLIE